MRLSLPETESAYLARLLVYFHSFPLLFCLCPGRKENGSTKWKTTHHWFTGIAPPNLVYIIKVASHFQLSSFPLPASYLHTISLFYTCWAFHAHVLGLGFSLGHGYGLKRLFGKRDMAERQQTSPNSVHASRFLPYSPSYIPPSVA